MPHSHILVTAPGTYYPWPGLTGTKAQLSEIKRQKASTFHKNLYHLF